MPSPCLYCLYIKNQRAVCRSTSSRTLIKGVEYKNKEDAQCPRVNDTSTSVAASANACLYATHEHCTCAYLGDRIYPPSTPPPNPYPPPPPTTTHPFTRPPTYRYPLPELTPEVQRVVRRATRSLSTKEPSQAVLVDLISHVILGPGLFDLHHRVGHVGLAGTDSALAKAGRGLC